MSNKMKKKISKLFIQIIVFISNKEFDNAYFLNFPETFLCNEMI